MAKEAGGPQEGRVRGQEARLRDETELISDTCNRAAGGALTAKQAPHRPGTATDCGTAPVYQFSVAPHAGAFRVVRDFSPSNSFAWTPMQEGAYDIEVAVKGGYQGTETTTAVVVDEVASRVTGSQAVITPT